MYRASRGSRCRRRLPLGDGDKLGALARENRVELDESGRVSIAGTDVTAAIRQSRIDRMVPVVARHPEVREVMRERQRELAELGDAVIEGRDIGTVVCPDADVKVYLVADRAVREHRRQAERPDIGADALATDLRARDDSDRARMQPAEDAEVIDTSDLDVEDVVDRIEALVRSRLAGMNRVDVALGHRSSHDRRPRAAIGAAPLLRRRAGPEGGRRGSRLNHFSWLDPPAFGACSAADDLLHGEDRGPPGPGLGQLIRAFGTFSVRRGESDREAVRIMREIVRDGHALGLFVEGTRQRAACPARRSAGAAMVALQEDVPVVPAAIHGSQDWKVGNFRPSRSPGASRCASRAAEGRQGLPRGLGDDPGRDPSPVALARRAARGGQEARRRHTAVSTEELLGTVAVVGFPNVGKSTLVNRLTGSRQAVVHETPGVTRDRKENRLRVGRRSVPARRHGRRRHRDPSPVTQRVADQARRAIAEADLVLFVVDTRNGITPGDEELAAILRRSRKPIFLIANKIDEPGREAEAFEFHRLGLGDPVPISRSTATAPATFWTRSSRAARERGRPRPGRRRSASRSSGNRTSASRACSTRCSARSG